MLDSNLDSPLIMRMNSLPYKRFMKLNDNVGSVNKKRRHRSLFGFA